MEDDTLGVLKALLQKMLTSRDRKCWASSQDLMMRAIQLAEQDQAIILQLALRPPVTIRLDAGPDRLDAIKN